VVAGPGRVQEAARAQESDPARGVVQLSRASHGVGFCPAFLSFSSSAFFRSAIFLGWTK
jgi:hypothetical protein